VICQVSDMEPLEDAVACPTVLTAELDEAVSVSLSRTLRNAGYNILKADDWSGAVQFITTHSRPIHFLVLNTDRASPETIEGLRPYRPKMQVLSISNDRTRSLPNVVDSVVTRLLGFLKESSSAVRVEKSRSFSLAQNAPQHLPTRHRLLNMSNRLIKRDGGRASREQRLLRDSATSIRVG